MKWFHRIDLGNGIVTPGVDDSPGKLKALELPSLAGKTVLDIGASDGLFSFAAERAGASRVLAVDAPAWEDTGWLGSKQAFDFAREALNSKVEDLHCDLYDLTPERVGTFDVVFFLGVLYHMEDPLGSLRHVARLTNELLVVETLIDVTWTSVPRRRSTRAQRSTPTGPTGGAPIRRRCWECCALRGFTTSAMWVSAIWPASCVSKAAYNFGNVAHSRLARGRAPLPWGYTQTDRGVFHAYR